MGCVLGPSNQIIIDRAKFFFDASAPWANQSATVFLNPFFNQSYGNYTIDSSFASIAGTGVSKFLDITSYQQFKNGITATKLRNAPRDPVFSSNSKSIKIIPTSRYLMFMLIDCFFIYTYVNVNMEKQE